MILNRVLHESSTKFFSRVQYYSPTIIFWSHDGMTSGFKSCHTKLCPSLQKSTGDSGIKLKRNEFSGKVRMGFIPEEFFQFLHPKTGVTGPYLLLFTMTNYLISKEIYVMEHEYYLGLSILLVVVCITKTQGKNIGAMLDKQVDAIQTEYETTRKDEKQMYKDIKKEAKLQIWRSEGQKLLMDAKKENVLMQLEAEYRNRAMQVYRMVKSRLDYQQAKHSRETRIYQKWMIEWILRRVLSSITPDFEKRALEAAISDLAAAAK